MVPSFLINCISNTRKLTQEFMEKKVIKSQHVRNKRNISKLQKRINHNEKIKVAFFGVNAIIELTLV
jgi:hypothetical protein